MPLFSHTGNCPICEAERAFTADHSWLRDHLVCSGCGSIPRERALFKVLHDYYPNYQSLAIHETSPCGRGASVKLRRECEGYSTSQYLPDEQPGAINQDGIRNENIESMTFADESFDLFVSQDVMEHVFDPQRAFREIARVLKPGGAHIFTVPMINKNKMTERCAAIDSDGAIEYFKEPEYHANPVDPKGSLVTMHWGYDIASYIQSTSGMPTIIHQIDNIDLGIRGEYSDVVVSLKHPVSQY